MRTEIDQAITTLQRIYVNNFFPDENTDYRARTDNLSHFVHGHAAKKSHLHDLGLLRINGGELLDRFVAPLEAGAQRLQAEVQRIADLGVEIKYNCTVGKDITAEARRNRRLDPQRLVAELEQHPEWIVGRDEQGWVELRYPEETTHVRALVQGNRLQVLETTADLALRGRVPVRWSWMWSAEAGSEPEVELFVDGSLMLRAQGERRTLTPEEIADVVARELMGGNTGHDVINALDNAVMGPTYRAGLMRHWALERMMEFEQQLEQHMNGGATARPDVYAHPDVQKISYSKASMDTPCCSTQV